MLIQSIFPKQILKTFKLNFQEHLITEKRIEPVRILKLIQVKLNLVSNYKQSLIPVIIQQLCNKNLKV